MKYSEQLVWKAVYEFVPNFKTVNESKVRLNLPSALKVCAEAIFLEIGLNGISSLGTNRSYAAYIIQDALKEMNSVGWMTFGEQQDYWR